MSLLRTAARASVATRVVGNTHRRQQQRWAAQDAAAATTAPAAAAAVAPRAQDHASASSTMLDQLAQLGHLRAAGVLSEEEFTTQKQRILAGG